MPRYGAPAPVAAAPQSAYAAAASSQSSVVARPEPIEIISSVYNAPTEDNQGYDWAYETANGIQANAQGELRTIGDAQAIVMRGSYTYTDENGRLIEVTWTADENGYVAESDVLPVAPAIPFPEQQAAVDAQIRFAEEQRANGVVFDGQPSEVVEVIEARQAPLASYSS